MLHHANAHVGGKQSISTTTYAAQTGSDPRFLSSDDNVVFWIGSMSHTIVRSSGTILDAKSSPLTLSNSIWECHVVRHNRRAECRRYFIHRRFVYFFWQVLIELSPARTHERNPTKTTAALLGEPLNETSRAIWKNIRNINFSPGVTTVRARPILRTPNSSEASKLRSSPVASRQCSA